jgi:hypothetical protein
MSNNAIAKGIWMTAVVSLVLNIRWANAESLFSQAPNFPGGHASQNAPNSFGSLYTTFDDFTLTQDATITNVQWQGSYDSQPVAGGISQFALIFWSDSAGLPGQALATYDILGSAGEDLVGISDGWYEYSYSANLPTSFVAAAHTTYWLSVQPTVNFPPQWYWRESTGGDDRCAQIIRSISPYPTASAGDCAFTLSGTPVPEPSAFALLGVAALGLMGWAWRRRKRAA